VLEALVNVNTLPGKEASVLSFPVMQQLFVLQMGCLSSQLYVAEQQARDGERGSGP
jgi:hypothetical protein